MILGSNVVVLHSAHYSTVYKTGMDRDPEFCFYWSEMLRARNLRPDHCAAPFPDFASSAVLDFGINYVPQNIL